MLKKLIPLVVLLLGLAIPAVALEPMSVDVGPVKLSLPFQNVDVIQLLEVRTQKGFTGAQTLLASHKDYEFTFGAATGYSNGVNFPFVSLQTTLSNKLVSINSVKFGVWFGHDWSGEDRHFKWGLAASVPLWK